MSHLFSFFLRRATAAIAFAAPVLFATPALRAQSDGSVDATFNAATSSGALTLAVVPQPDGRLIVGGNFNSVNGTPRAGLARVNADGSLDSAFNAGAVPNGFVTSVALQPDGKIIVAGFALKANGTGATTGVARFHADGSLDPTFAAATGTTGAVYAITLQADGKILVGGDFTSVNGTARNRIARLNPDGSIDPGFNPGSGANSASFSVYSLAVQSDAKILLAGAFTTFNGASRPHIARLNPDGSLDATFDPGVGANGMTNCLAIQSDGKILLGGDFTSVGGVVRNGLVRLNFNGSVDPSYDAHIPPGAYVNTLARQADGKVVVGGQFPTVNGIARDGIARLNSDGTLDSTFNPGAGAAGSAVYVATLVPGGTLVLGGNFATMDGAAHVGLARMTDAGAIASPLINIATRARVDAGENVVIGGFVIAGTGPKRVMVRAIGPSLAAAGIVGPLLDPVLTLYDAQGNAFATNDSWQSTQAAEITAAGLAPSDPRECAIVASLAPGAYTAIISSNGAGVALVEVYDLENLNGVGVTPARLVNISTRAQVGLGENVVIGGFAVRGGLSKRVLVRAIGPSLAARGVVGCLLDPILNLFDQRGVPIGSNDNWQTDEAAAIIASGFPPTDNRESAILALLPPGNYTAIISGVGGSTGVALIEAYEVP